MSDREESDGRVWLLVAKRTRQTLPAKSCLQTLSSAASALGMSLNQIHPGEDLREVFDHHGGELKEAFVTLMEEINNLEKENRNLLARLSSLKEQGASGNDQEPGMINHKLTTTNEVHKLSDSEHSSWEKDRTNRQLRDGLSAQLESVEGGCVDLELKALKAELASSKRMVTFMSEQMSPISLALEGRTAEANSLEGLVATLRGELSEANAKLSAANSAAANEARPCRSRNLVRSRAGVRQELTQAQTELNTMEEETALEEVTAQAAELRLELAEVEELRAALQQQAAEAAEPREELSAAQATLSAPSTTAVLAQQAAAALEEQTAEAAKLREEQLAEAAKLREELAAAQYDEANDLVVLEAAELREELAQTQAKLGAASTTATVAAHAVQEAQLRVELTEAHTKLSASSTAAALEEQTAEAAELREEQTAEATELKQKLAESQATLSAASTTAVLAQQAAAALEEQTAEAAKLREQQLAEAAKLREELAAARADEENDNVVLETAKCEQKLFTSPIMFETPPLAVSEAVELRKEPVTSSIVFTPSSVDALSSTGADSLEERISTLRSRFGLPSPPSSSTSSSISPSLNFVSCPSPKTSYESSRLAGIVGSMDQLH